MNNSCHKDKYTQIAADIKRIAFEIGFNKIGITDTNLVNEEPYLNAWLERGYFGCMDYLQRNLDKRLKPKNLVSDTKSIICLGLCYPKNSSKNEHIASFAQIENYTKKIKKLLQSLCQKIGDNFQYRVFSGTAPILEKALAAKAGLGWVGKNTLILNQDSGSFMLLGEIFTNLELPKDAPVKNRCGNCTKCIESCPTKALVKPYQLDATKCISYFTIEYDGSIPEEMRHKIGKRIFGCDACQNACPWNQRISYNTTQYFDQNLNLNNYALSDLMLWDEAMFREKTQKTPLKRISFECWLRNIAVALGNSEPTEKNINALKQRCSYNSDLVKEHCRWALNTTSNVPSGKDGSY